MIGINLLGYQILGLMLILDLIMVGTILYRIFDYYATNTVLERAIDGALIGLLFGFTAVLIILGMMRII